MLQVNNLLAHYTPLAKFFLQATMSQATLKSVTVMTLYVHKDHTDNLCLTEVANEFVRGSSHRQAIFGSFLTTDLDCNGNIIIINLCVNFCP